MRRAHRKVRISVTDRCTFKCRYCVPDEEIPLLPREGILSFEEICRFVVDCAVPLGLNRLRLTGGDPLVRRGLTGLVARLKGLRGVERIGLTTNADRLAPVALELKEAGLDGVNISLDTIRPERFRQITRGGDLDRVLRGLRAAKRAGLGSVKINSVVILGFNDDELLELTSFAAAEGVVLRFIEFMPIGVDTIWHRNSWLPASEIKRVLSTEYTLESEGRESGKGPARYWRVRGQGMPPEGGMVGIIAAMSEGFCDSCNRVRLTAQGGLRACLADDNEVDLRAVIRSGGGEEEILEAVREALSRKDESHHFCDGGTKVAEKEMVRIGG